MAPNFQFTAKVRFSCFINHLTNMSFMILIIRRLPPPTALCETKDALYTEPISKYKLKNEVNLYWLSYSLLSGNQIFLLGKNKFIL
jgi:hypothetical protein